MDRRADADALRSADEAGFGPPLPEHVARVLSYLANLIDSSIALRGAGTGVRDFAARFLRVPAPRVVATVRKFDGAVRFQLVALAFAEELREHPPAEVIGEDEDEPPRWEQLDLADDGVSVPSCLAAAFPAGGLAPVPIVVFVGRRFDDETFVVRVHSRAEDAEVAGAWLDGLVERARVRTNPFRNRTLRAFVRPPFGLCFGVLPPPDDRREDLVLSPEVWDTVDRDVHGLFGAVDRLRTAGLATNRGVLLAGPPGTGKTALCRVLAAELSGRVTTVFSDAAAVATQVGSLYRELEDLAPALVVMEDVDLVVGHRAAGAGGALLSFLVSLDGGTTRHEGVVTIATTNDLEAIDAAARRAGRMDTLVRIDPPSREAREAILRRYLRSLPGARVDVARVAAATPGATGADLRELVSGAVLRAAATERRGEAGELSTELLLELARERGPGPPPGQYL